MLLLLVVLVLLMWGGGFAMSVGGDLIHALLVIAIVVALVHYFTPLGGRNRTSL